MSEQLHRAEVIDGNVVRITMPDGKQFTMRQYYYDRLMHLDPITAQRERVLFELALERCSLKETSQTYKDQKELQHDWKP